MHAQRGRLAALCCLGLIAVAPQAAAQWQVVAGGPGTQCALGDPYYFFARVAAPDSVLVFIAGGGACWDAAGCDPEGRRLARTTVDTTSRYSNGVLNVADPRNPFRNYSMLIVSYCTGDLHLGARSVEYRRRAGGDSSTTLLFHHVGARNAHAALDWLGAHVPSPRHIVVAGQSGGAVPSPYIAAVLARRYPSAAVAQIGDAAGALRIPGVTASLLRQWGGDSVLAADGLMPTGPAGRLTLQDLYVAAAARAPNLRVAQVNSVDDSTQLMFLRMFGLRDVTVAALLDSTMAELSTALPGFRFFVADGYKHVFLGSRDLYDVSTEGVRMLDWVANVAAGREAANVGATVLARRRT